MRHKLRVYSVRWPDDRRLWYVTCTCGKWEPDATQVWPTQAMALAESIKHQSEHQDNKPMGKCIGCETYEDATGMGYFKLSGKWVKRR